MFVTTPLEPAERERLGPELRQPCPHLVARSCAIYPGRPRTCREYLCPAAAALERGELTLDQAARVVRSSGTCAR